CGVAEEAACARDGPSASRAPPLAEQARSARRDGRSDPQTKPEEPELAGQQVGGVQDQVEELELRLTSPPLDGLVDAVPWLGVDLDNEVNQVDHPIFGH